MIAAERKRVHRARKRKDKVVLGNLVVKKATLASLVRDGEIRPEGVTNKAVALEDASALLDIAAERSEQRQISLLLGRWNAVPHKKNG